MRIVWVCAACRQVHETRPLEGCCAKHGVRVEGKSLQYQAGIVVDCQGAPYCEARRKDP